MYIKGRLDVPENQLWKCVIIEKYWILNLYSGKLDMVCQVVDIHRYGGRPEAVGPPSGSSWTTFRATTTPDNCIDAPLPPVARSIGLAKIWEL